MSINDNRMMSPNKQYDHKQSDYDNMPALFAAQNGVAPPTAAAAAKPPRLGQYHQPQTSASNGTFDMTNGPPGYFQSLPQSSFMRHQLEKQQQQPPPQQQQHPPLPTSNLPPMSRFNSTAETISNFINGNGPLSTFNSFPR